MPRPLMPFGESPSEGKTMLKKTSAKWQLGNSKLPFPLRNIFLRQKLSGPILLELWKTLKVLQPQSKHPIKKRKQSSNSKRVLWYFYLPLLCPSPAWQGFWSWSDGSLVPSTISRIGRSREDLICKLLCTSLQNCLGDTWRTGARSWPLLCLTQKSYRKITTQICNMTTVPQTSGARDYRWKHKSLSKAQEKSWGATEKLRGN